jgi:hypothetical protein
MTSYNYPIELILRGWDQTDIRNYLFRQSLRPNSQLLLNQTLDPGTEYAPVLI